MEVTQEKQDAIHVLLGGFGLNSTCPKALVDRQSNPAAFVVCWHYKYFQKMVKEANIEDTTKYRYETKDYGVELQEIDDDTYYYAYVMRFHIWPVDESFCKTTPGNTVHSFLIRHKPTTEMSELVDEAMKNEGIEIDG